MTEIEQYGIEISEEDYLKKEQTSPVRHQYIDGKAYAMSGASIAHGRIVANLMVQIGNHLNGKPCEVLAQGVRLKAGKDYYYPDLLVDCNQLPGDGLVCTAPVLVIEVLSKSTRLTDMTRKLSIYLDIPSLKEYVLIEQDRVKVQVLKRDSAWLPEDYLLGSTVILPSIGLALPVEEIYARVLAGQAQET